MDSTIAPFQHILVVLDASEDFAIPLTRASQMCKLMDAKMSVLISCFAVLSVKNKSALNDDLGDMVDQLREDVKEQLEQLKTVELLDKTFLSWQEKTSLATQRLIEDRKFDLVIKAPVQQGEFKKLFRSGLDKYFVSDCPLPVWMIKPREWDQDIQVMACIDMADKAHENVLMNKHILSISDRLTGLLGGHMHVTDCFYGEIGSMRVDYNSKRGFKRQASVKEQHLEQLKSYIHDYSLMDDQLHFEEGIPDDVIPSRAAALGAELVVIGNNEDSNIFDRIMGDTAVTLTQAMPCDILILKLNN
ncbi:universal stress protein [Glaciecola sp. 1036]|uniref:universal stress protein n=1 Tax=Alteromonadaceae TaxID=72275 RepID=UPI003CFD7354